MPKATDKSSKTNSREKPWHLLEIRTLSWVGQGLFLLGFFSSKWKKTPFLGKQSVPIHFYTLLLDDNGCCSLYFQTKTSVFLVQNYLKVVEKKKRNGSENFQNSKLIKWSISLAKTHCFSNSLLRVQLFQYRIVWYPDNFPRTGRLFSA